MANGESQAVGEQRTLYFARVPRTHLEDKIAGIFRAFGTVEDIVLFRRNARSSVSKGCGLVTMGNHEEAEAALAALNGSLLFGPDEEAMIVRWMEPGLQTPNSKRGEQPPAAAAEVILERPAHPPDGCGPDAIKLYIGNLPLSIVELDLIPMLKPFGNIVDLCVARNKTNGVSQGCAFVWFQTKAQAEAAMKALNLKHILTDPAGVQPGPLLVRRARSTQKISTAHGDKGGSGSTSKSKQGDSNKPANTQPVGCGSSAEQLAHVSVDRHSTEHTAQHQQQQQGGTQVQNFLLLDHTGKAGVQASGCSAPESLSGRGQMSQGGTTPGRSLSSDLNANTRMNAPTTRSAGGEPLRQDSPAGHGALMSNHPLARSSKVSGLPVPRTSTSSPSHGDTAACGYINTHAAMIAQSGSPGLHGPASEARTGNFIVRDSTPPGVSGLGSGKGISSMDAPLPLNKFLQNHTAMRYSQCSVPVPPSVELVRAGSTLYRSDESLVLSNKDNTSSESNVSQIRSLPLTARISPSTLGTSDQGSVGPRLPVASSQPLGYNIGSLEAIISVMSAPSRSTNVMPDSFNSSSLASQPGAAFSSSGVLPQFQIPAIAGASLNLQGAGAASSVGVVGQPSHAGALLLDSFGGVSEGPGVAMGVGHPAPALPIAPQPASVVLPRSSQGDDIAAVVAMIQQQQQQQAQQNRQPVQETRTINHHVHLNLQVEQQQQQQVMQVQSIGPVQIVGQNGHVLYQGTLPEQNVILAPSDGIVSQNMSTLPGALYTQRQPAAVQLAAAPNTALHTPPLQLAAPQAVATAPQKVVDLALIHGSGMNQVVSLSAHQPPAVQFIQQPVQSLHFEPAVNTSAPVIGRIQSIQQTQTVGRSISVLLGDLHLVQVDALLPHIQATCGATFTFKPGMVQHELVISGTHQQVEDALFLIQSVFSAALT